MSGHRNSRDPRGQLFRDYVEIVNKLKPEVFVMENVKGILSMFHDKEKLTKANFIISTENNLESTKVEVASTVEQLMAIEPKAWNEFYGKTK